MEGTNKLGRNIVEYRKKNRLTQAAFAELLFVSNKTVSRWETGKGEPDLEQLARISELIGVPVATLIGGAKPQADERGGGVSPMNKRLRIVMAVCLTLALAAAVIVPVLLVTLIGGAEPDVTPPVDTAKTEITNKFEAEYAQLKAVNPQLDGTDSFVERAATASNGLHTAYFGAKGNTITFDIDSEAADANATLYVALASMWDDLNSAHLPTDFDEVWELYVNGVRIKANASYVLPNGSRPFHEFVEVSVKIALVEGENVIKLVCPQTGDGQYGLNTDYIRIETVATLSWVPYKENKIRPE